MNEVASYLIDSGRKEETRVQKHFSQSSKSYLSVANLQRIVGRNLLNKLQPNNNSRLLDLGAGPGTFSGTLNSLCQQCVSFDLSYQMLKQNDTLVRVQGDSQALPFANESFDVVFSSLMIQWCDFYQVSKQIYDCLKPGGVAVLSTLICGTLNEYKRSWQAIDDDNHVHQYLNQEDIIKQLHKLPWQTVEIEKKPELLWYPSVKDLARELKSLGANYVKDRKNRGLVTPKKWRAMEQTYHQKYFDAEKSLYPATYNVIYMKLQK